MARVSHRDALANGQVKSGPKLQKKAKFNWAAGAQKNKKRPKKGLKKH
jgi:hypothetical protein